MTTIEKIKAEIERLYNGEAPKHDQQCDFDDGYFTGIGAISQFIDTLESEKPMNFDFNYEFSHFLDKKDEELGSTTWSEEDLQELARHFYEIGCRRTAEKYDEIEYNRQRAEEKPMNQDGLEEKVRMIEEWVTEED